MLKPLFIIVIALASVLYILNPGAGIFELIPDNIPIIGNLDEASAVVIFLACLRYFNIDLSNFFKRSNRLSP